jgi:hypothetical protein
MAKFFKYDPARASKGGRKPKADFNPDSFICKFELSNSEDWTGITHTFEAKGNKEGINNYFNCMFNFLFVNHYKPSLQNKKRPYDKTINYLALHSSSNNKILKDNTIIKSSLVDRHLLSLLTTTTPTLEPNQINKLTKAGLKEYEDKTSKLTKLSSLTPEQIEKLLKLIE